jgi:hypothetical protein
MPKENMSWLPDPVFKEDEDGHYKSYSEVNGQDTTEADRPTYTPATTNPKLGKKRKAPAKTSEPVNFNIISSDPDVQGDFSLTAQTARSIIKCVECLKPRVIYGKLKLSGRQELQLAELLSEFNYSCGAPLTPPGYSLHGKTTVKLGINCSSPLEVAYYSSSQVLGPTDICYYCGKDGASFDIALKERFKSVLPVCGSCLEKGLVYPTFRPYGKAKTKK